MSQRFAFQVELLPNKVDDYVALHREVWPEVERKFHEVGVRSLSLFLQGTTLFMVMEYVGSQPFAAALAEYAADPKIQEWEAVNRTFKRPTAEGSAATGFTSMQEIYRLPPPN